MNIISITELSPFSKKAQKILSSEDRESLYSYLIQHPEKGDVIPGTGGIRKLRWAASGKGKRGGARIIYFYHVIGSTIYLMACYTKNEQSDLSSDAKKQFKTFADLLKKRK